jgi:hypothetical protein
MQKYLENICINQFISLFYEHPSVSNNYPLVFIPVYFLFISLVYPPSAWLL